MSNYNELIQGKVYIGGADAILQAVSEKGITDVFDLRDGGERSADFPPTATRHILPIVEDQSEHNHSVQQAIQTIKTAVDQGKTVYFHCSGGRNRTGTVATGLLMEMKLANQLSEAEIQAKQARPDIQIKKEMYEVLERLYPTMG